MLGIRNPVSNNSCLDVTSTNIFSMPGARYKLKGLALDAGYLKKYFRSKKDGTNINMTVSYYC